MNDEIPNEEVPATTEELTEAFVAARETILSGEDDAAADMLNALQDEVDELQEALATSEERVAELEAAPVVAAAPAGDDELRGLATTYRAAVRNGHPDAPRHLEILLSALGA